MRRYMACVAPTWNQPCNLRLSPRLSDSRKRKDKLFQWLVRTGRGHSGLISLTFAGYRGLTPALLGKTFFSTRRPALETGGQRPTARCALGRESVWTIVLAFRARTYNRPSYPAKA